MQSVRMESTLDKKIKFPEISVVYPTLPSMIRKYGKISRQDYFRGNTESEFVSWKQLSRELLQKLLGLDKMEDCEGWSKLSSVEELSGGIRREHLFLETEPDVWVPIYILYPECKEADQLYGGIGDERSKNIFLCPPGHGGAGKYSIAGLHEYEMVEKAIEHYNYDIGLQIAKQGYITVCPDVRGFGEMREELYDTADPNTLMKGDCYWLAHMGEPLGIPVLGMLTWDLSRIVDYLTERFYRTPISCVGFSGGGMQSMYLAALDDRIDSVMISGYMYGFKDSLLKMNRNCSCNYVPHLFEHFDMGDIASLICPRRLLIQSGSMDHLSGERGMENVYEQINILRKAYGLMEVDELLHHEVCEGPHQFYSENLDKNLRFLCGK